MFNYYFLFVSIFFCLSLFSSKYKIVGILYFPVSDKTLYFSDAKMKSPQLFRHSLDFIK